MFRNRPSMAWIIAAVLGCVLLLMLIIRPFGGSARNPRGPEFPPELADAIRDGVAMTREARRDAIDGIAGVNRWRLFAIVIGVCVPIIIAYLVLRLAATNDPNEADLLVQINKASKNITRRKKREKEDKCLSEGNADEDAPQDSPADESSDDQ